MSTWSTDYQVLANLTFTNNKVKYAEKHGYKTHFKIHTDPNDILWDRPRQWEQVLLSIPENDWLWVSGTDLFITRPDYRLEDFIDDTAEFMCAVDHHQVFGDCFIIKNCPNSIRLIREVLARRNEFPNEQWAFSTILSKSQTFGHYCEKAGYSNGTTEFYKRSEDILNSNYVKVKVWDVSQPKKISGDIPWLHDDPNVVPPCHAWYEDTFSLHVGGKSLKFRLGFIPLMTENLKFD